MKIAIVGSRTGWTEKEIHEYLDHYKSKNNLDVKEVVSGGAIGVDTFAESWAKKNDIKTFIFYPNWSKYGRGAGMIRNKLIIDRSDSVIAFMTEGSKGTKNSVNYAKKQNKLLLLFERKTNANTS
ncbi:DUF2493 domain-containing protein [Patescibacteria group bacterium]|nr:DUF2493 domain-containing protein [Patescibacteria group bacterium]